jgi:diguanylate cyclase (GGDEF)-like protein
MNGERRQPINTNLDEWQRAQRPQHLLRFASVVPLSTAGGCLVVALCLWGVLPDGWQAWLAGGLCLAVAQWRGQRLIAGASQPRRSTGREVIDRRRWVTLNALAGGVFWGITSVALFPAGSIEHQLLLAFVLMAVTALWLPLFALARLSLLLFTLPGLLPMAFALLISPEPPQTTMGSLLLLLIGVFAAVAQATSRVFFADFAARRALYHQATHDSLVGLANRAEFHRRAQTLEIMGAQTYAIAFIDLDHFKEVNDTAGHAAGDDLLRHIGRVLREAVRKEDLAARLGGDEFAILMADCGAEEAAQVAATILERIRAFGLSSGGRRRRVTASIGIACSADLCASPAKLLEAADQACYAAKRGGRNRIEVATSVCEEATPPSNDTAFELVTHASI